MTRRTSKLTPSMHREPSDVPYHASSVRILRLCADANLSILIFCSQECLDCPCGHEHAHHGPSTRWQPWKPTDPLSFWCCSSNNASIASRKGQTEGTLLHFLAAAPPTNHKDNLICLTLPAFSFQLYHPFPTKALIKTRSDHAFNLITALTLFFL